MHHFFSIYLSKLRFFLVFLKRIIYPEDLKWPSLQQRHQHLSVMYKISSQLVDTDSSCYLIMSQLNTRCHSARIFQSSCNSVVYANSHFPRTIRDWNQLSINPLDYKTVDSFKSYLNLHTTSKFSSYYYIQMHSLLACSAFILSGCV